MRITRESHVYSLGVSEPVATVTAPCSLTVETCDCFNGQVTEDGQPKARLNFSHVNPATGPIVVEGAEPGDVLRVHIRAIRPEKTGALMTAPGAGALPDRVKGDTRICPIADGHFTFMGVELPLNPMIGVIGVAPAPEYTFRILVTPVGPYFKGGLKPIKLRVSEYDRAAPHGTGNIKAGLNYAMSLRPTMEAHRNGYAENIYLDSQSRTYIEETGGANVLFVKEDGTLVVPKSHTDSILPSITRRSLVQVAQDLGMTVDERYVTWEEVAGGEFVECGLCGTAAVISPVGQIDNKVNGADQEVVFPAGCTEIGPVMKQLRETLTGIQDGNLEDKHGWVCKIDVD